MSQSLEHKVVLITGASSGIGADAARLFARQDCRVILSARRVDRLQALAAEIDGSGGQAMVVPMDVTKRSQIEAAILKVMQVYGRIDILFNNAGLGRLDWLENLNPEEDIDSQIDINLRGLIQVTRTVLPHMLAQRSGCIINMSSMAGLIAAPLYTLYAATKFGVRGFTDALRREVSPLGIRVCVLYPGPVISEFGRRSSQSVAKRRIRTPRIFNMSSEYVARRVVGLARHPRRVLIIPWWFRPIAWLSFHFPGLIDWLVKIVLVQRSHVV